ncbi:hypothetical protein L3X38_016846 [Prunus dulcis]|uniref:Uncharacterized protein n=1 Tax=Prunus dulcis TaxID=3755 RepID=A0AAD4W620_PRUDU|nr:hypothetical protein L3X38_016846 [Prunus dulcis]
MAYLCRRKEVHLHLRSPEKLIRATGVAPLFQTRDARNMLYEMPKPNWALRYNCCTLSATRMGSCGWVEISIEGGATGSRKTGVSVGLKWLEIKIRKAAYGFVWEDQFGGCG